MILEAVQVGLVFLATMLLVVWAMRFVKRAMMSLIDSESQRAFESGIDAGCRLVQAYGELCQRSCPYRNGVHAGASDAPVDPQCSAQPPPPDPSIAEPQARVGGGRPSVDERGDARRT